MKTRILAGEMAPGSRLHQAQLSEELGTSRTPLREALSRLAVEGLVELLPQRGARVVDLKLEDMESAYGARLVIEPAAAALAAELADPAAIKKMERAIASHRSHAEDAKAVFQDNRAFHLALVEASGNPFLSRFAESLWVGRLGRTIYTAQGEPLALIQRDAAEHAAIAAAIAAGDPALARRLTHEHIAGARELLHGSGAEPR
ncbi:MAG: GntR family transcriptional regulator [Actinobacteria bacterium]|nr:GntR family transcriptional regulator [Actinomycetota bacterium]